MANGYSLLSDPTQQSDFVDIITKIEDLKEGHQCYSIPADKIPRDAEEGTKATIQLEYWAQEEGAKKKESFFACADIVSPSCFTSSQIFNL